jgi:hypothetical protein
MTTSTTLGAQATARAKHKHLRPITCQRLDTGETIWLVQSRSDPSRYYLLTTTGNHVHCTCPQAVHRGICAHATAVGLECQAESQQGPSSACSPQPQSPAPRDPRQDPRSAFQREQERQQRADAERRERALLWTDDRPFSIWK